MRLEEDHVAGIVAGMLLTIAALAAAAQAPKNSHAVAYMGAFTG